MSLAKTANGCPILRSYPTPANGPARAGAIVLCDISATNRHTPFVTWWMNEDGAILGGDYFVTRSAADADFDAQVAREQRLYGTP
jgi:hypothetical protein